ncbi:MAG TPA: nuclear transport factor 2 family protein [Acidimicrobiales bacterium]
METSDEIRTALESLIETFGSPAMGKSFLETISTEPGTLVIGTDPDEWWDDLDRIKAVMTAQSDELQGMSVKLEHAEGWVERDVGWGAGKMQIALPGETPVTTRITAVFTRRPDGWKMAQAHASMGVSNKEALGKDLTT